MGTDLLDVTQLATVAAKRHTAILDETGGSETLEVLGAVLGPVQSHLRTARLLGELDS